MTTLDVPDTVTIEVQPGATVVITSDLHFAGTRTEASAWAEQEVCQALEAVQGPGVYVMAGDVFELWAGTQPTADEAMASHPRFEAAVKDFASGPDRHVVCLPGNHDGSLGWDAVAAEVPQRMGARMAFAVDLVLPGEQGPERVHIEHGHRWDPANAFENPRDPVDTPLGQHIVQELLPDLAARNAEGVLEGVESLEDPRTFPSFITSRVFYRRLLKETRWLLVPVVLAIAVHLGLDLADTPLHLHLSASDFVVLDVAIIVLAAVTALVVVLAGRHAWKGAALTVTEKRGKGQNDNARTAAQQLVSTGYRGMVSGHTHHPELSPLGTGFYANTGSGTKIVEAVDARFNLPHVYEAKMQLSYVMLHATDRGWQANLVIGHRPIPGTRIERMATPSSEKHPENPAVVASYP
ncbi:MAG: metallophosphoesterase [Acidimicrobiia bacterium]|nr:metallophosphoesterase [Acidimicrobiia bacterium]